MADIFYLYSIVYAIFCVRAIYHSSKNSVKTFDYINKINATKFFEAENFQQQTERLDKIKNETSEINKDIKRWQKIRNYIDWCWNLVGILVSIQSIYFVLLLIFRLLSMFMPLTFKSVEQARRNMIIANIIEGGLCLFIAYNHFYNL